MKHNDIDDKTITKLKAQNLENLFEVYTNDNSTYFYNILRTVNFPSDINPNVYFEYDVQPKDTWPLIAWKHYKDIRLWWIICSLNNVINPVAQPEQGTKIKILNTELVREILTEIRDT